MVLEIKARFGYNGVNDLNSERDPLDTPLRGRAYVFHTPNGSDTLGGIGESYKYLHDVIASEQFNQLKNSGILFTNAIMWEDKGHPMIDFFAWDFGDRQNYDWNSNPEIRTWVTRNGVIVPGNEINDFTCEKGMIIMASEGRHRLVTPDLKAYLDHAPHIPDLKYTIGNFTRKEGKRMLDSILSGN